MRWWWSPLCTRPTPLVWFFIVLAHWNNSTLIDMSLHADTLSSFRANQSLLFLHNAECLAEKQQIPILYFHCINNLHSYIMVAVNVTYYCKYISLPAYFVSLWFVFFIYLFRMALKRFGMLWKCMIGRDTKK